MGKGGYTGGSTIIGPKSGWFSKPSKSAEASFAQSAAQKARLRAEAKTDAKAKAVKAREEKRLAAIEYKTTPEYAASAAERKKVQRIQKLKRLEERLDFTNNAKKVEIYVRKNGRVRLVKTGIDCFVPVDKN